MILLDFLGQSYNAITYSHIIGKENVHTHKHTLIHTQTQSDSRDRHKKDAFRAKECQKLEEAWNAPQAPEGVRQHLVFNPVILDFWAPEERTSNCVLSSATREVLTIASRRHRLAPQLQADPNYPC